MIRSGVLLGALMAVLSPAWADGQLYQWKDASGRIHFSDSAPAAALGGPDGFCKSDAR